MTFIDIKISCQKSPWSGFGSGLYPESATSSIRIRIQKNVWIRIRGIRIRIQWIRIRFLKFAENNSTNKINTVLAFLHFEFFSSTAAVPYKPKLNDARTVTCASFPRWFPRPHPASTSPNLGHHPPETLPIIYVLKPVMYNLDRQSY